MAELNDISSVVNNSLYLKMLDRNTLTERVDQLKERIKELQGNNRTTDINEEFKISLKDFTNLNSYNTVMNMIYGANSANKFQNFLEMYTNDNETKLANAKSFIERMKENGMSTNKAVKTYTALQKYSLMSSLGNFNFVNAKI